MILGSSNGMNNNSNGKKKLTYTQALLQVESKIDQLNIVVRSHMSQQKALNERYDKMFENIFERLEDTEKQLSFHSGTLKASGIISVVLATIYVLVKLLG